MTSSTGADLIRSLFAAIDRTVYGFIGTLYEIIELIAQHELLNSVDEIANKLYSFIGIFMLFKITFSLINYIINPDTMTDKEKGGSKLVINIIITFALIIVEPLGFKLLYEAQAAILEEQIIMRIILGDSEDTKNKLYISNLCKEAGYPIITPSKQKGTAEYRSTGEFIAMITIRPFVQVDDDANASLREELKEKGYCEVNSIKKLLNTEIVNLDKKVTLANGSKKSLYALDYGIFISTIVGIIVLLIFAGFCLDAALRTIKLYFLQIIAPIPIMSYMDPASSKKGLFSKWLKEVGTTWGDLFLRLAAIYFAIFLISNIQLNASDNFYVNLILILGALLFAKKLPDILKKMFNIDLKGDFKLNPLKKYKEAVDVGRSVLRSAYAPVGGAVGLVAGATNFKNGNTWKQRFANGFSGIKKGVVNGVKNPFSITKGGLSPVTEPYFEKVKKSWKEQDEAASKLNELHKLNDKGQKLIDNAKTGNIKDGKYEIDQTKNFKNQEYIDSFNKVKKANTNVELAQNDYDRASTRVDQLINNKASQQEIDAATAIKSQEKLKLDKMKNALSKAKEDHQVIQARYTDDSKAEKAMKIYMDKNPNYLNVSNANIDNAKVNTERTQSSSPQANPASQNANRNQYGSSEKHQQYSTMEEQIKILEEKRKQNLREYSEAKDEKTREELALKSSKYDEQLGELKVEREDFNNKNPEVAADYIQDVVIPNKNSEIEELEKEREALYNTFSTSEAKIKNYGRDYAANEDYQKAKRVCDIRELQIKDAENTRNNLERRVRELRNKSQKMREEQLKQEAVQQNTNEAESNNSSSEQNIEQLFESNTNNSQKDSSEEQKRNRKKYLQDEIAKWREEEEELRKYYGVPRYAQTEEYEKIQNKIRELEDELYHL